MERFLSRNGGSGVAVEQDGNITGVFNDPAVSGKRGVVDDLLVTALSNGGTKLDAFATYGFNDLRTKYSDAGFVPVAWMEYDPTYQEDGWDLGTPDVVFWAHNGDTPAEVARKVGTYRLYTEADIHALPKFTDYDAAMAYRDSQLDRVRSDPQYRETEPSIEIRQFSSWDVAFLGLENNPGAKIKLSDPPRLSVSDTMDAGYLNGNNDWPVIKTYPATAEGLARFNREANQLERFARAELRRPQQTRQQFVPEIEEHTGSWLDGVHRRKQAYTTTDGWRT